MGIKKQCEYNDAYQKENITRVVVKFNKQSQRDEKILDHLYKLREQKKIKSIQEYIKQAVEEKMNK